MTLWRTVAKLWCHKLCAVFGAPCILSFGRHQIPILQVTVINKGLWAKPSHKNDIN